MLRCNLNRVWGKSITPQVPGFRGRFLRIELSVAATGGRLVFAAPAALAAKRVAQRLHKGVHKRRGAPPFGQNKEMS